MQQDLIQKGVKFYKGKFVFYIICERFYHHFFKIIHNSTKFHSCLKCWMWQIKQNVTHVCRCFLWLKLSWEHSVNKTCWFAAWKCLRCGFWVPWSSISVSYHLVTAAEDGTIFPETALLLYEVPFLFCMWALDERQYRKLGLPWTFKLICILFNNS